MSVPSPGVESMVMEPWTSSIRSFILASPSLASAVQSGIETAPRVRHGKVDGASLAPQPQMGARRAGMPGDVPETLLDDPIEGKGDYPRNRRGKIFVIEQYTDSLFFGKAGISAFTALTSPRSSRMEG